MTRSTKIQGARQQGDRTPRVNWQQILSDAQERGLVKEIDALLAEPGAPDVNDGGIWQETPLRWAAVNSGPELCRLLIARGADVNATNERGNTALLGLAEQLRPCIETVEVLITAGADVNAANKKGRTALIQATKYGHLEIVEMLIAAGADVNIRNAKGRTALHHAVDSGRTQIVARLLDAGALVDVESLRGETPIGLAWARMQGTLSGRDGNLRVLAMLKAARKRQAVQETLSAGSFSDGITPGAML